MAIYLFNKIPYLPVE